MTEIRAATVADAEALVQLGAAMHAESRYRDVPYSAEKVRATLCRLIESGQGAAFLAERNGRPVGGIVGTLTAPWFSDALTACDLALYVDPECRGLGVAPILVDRLIRWAESHGVAYLEISVSSGVNPARASAMLQRLGGEFVGGLFVWRRAQQEEEAAA